MVKKLVVLVLVILAVGAGCAAAKYFPGKSTIQVLKPKNAILKVALVADSHNNNDLLAKALAQAKAAHVDFVIGLGDYTNTGTIDELNAAKNVFDASGLTYYVTAGDHDLWDSRNKELKVGGGEASMSALDNFRQVFVLSEQEFTKNQIHFVILDNSDIYKGIDAQGWKMVESLSKREVDPQRVDIEDQPLLFVFAHKMSYHPDSAHIMGETTPAVANQAKQVTNLIESTHPCHSGERSDSRMTQSADSGYMEPYGPRPSASGPKARMTSKLCPAVDGFFSGDLHFFANFNSPNGSVKMTTIGAVTREPNPQGPRFGVLTVYDDYTWEVADVEIR
jgi:hypothetical protein